MMMETVLSRSVRLICAGGMAFGMQAAYAQEAEPAMQKIEVTGSRIPTTNVEGASPLTTLTAKDIKLDGARNVESLLNNLPQVFADQGSTVANGSTGTATVNLRGLGADRTLVLVNGRRLPMGSPTNVAADISQIPVALIKKVEVLTGGAGAVYGSDAVAGVVNFIMNDRFQGVQIEANGSGYNHDQKGGVVADLVRSRGLTNPNEFQLPGNAGFDGKSKEGSLLIGSNFADDKGNATLFFSYKKDDALLQGSRDFSSCSLSSSAAGFACGGSGTNATGQIIGPAGTYTNTGTAGQAIRYSGARDAYNFGPLNHYQRPSEKYGFNGTVNYDVSDKMRLYAEFAFSDNKTTAQIAPGGIFGEATTVGYDNPLLSASWRQALGLVNPGDTADITILRRNVEGGGRMSEFRNTSFRTLAGVKGEIGKWNYDAFFQTAKVIYNQNEANYFSSQRILRALNVVNVGGVATCQSVVDGSDPSCVPYNAYQLGGVTAAQLAYLQIPGMRQGSTEQQIQGGTLASDLGEYGIKTPWATNGVGVSFGAEHRREKLSLSTDAATASGDLSGSGGPTGGVNGQYSVRDIFGEARVPLVEKKPFMEALTATASYRHSKISTADSDQKTNTYGFGLEWAPVQEVRFRGTYQRAVRAANLIELFTPSGNSLFDFDADPCAGEAPTASLATCARTGVTAAQYGNIPLSSAGQYNYLQGGNTQLTPEKSKSKTFGVVLTPVRNLSLTADYFDIKIEDTIGIVSPGSTFNKCLNTGDAAACALITRDRIGSLWLFDEGKIIGTNQNIGGTRTTGIDFGASYSYRIGAMGTLGLNMNGTLLKKLETEEVKGEGIYDCVGLYGSDRCGAPNPKWRHKVRANWNTPWNVDLAVTWRHIDEVLLQNTDSNPLLSGTVNAVDRELGKRDYMDLAAAWAATKNISVTGGINNVFDRDPPLTSQLSTGVGNGNTYPGVYDTLGRKLFLNLTAKF